MIAKINNWFYQFLRRSQKYTDTDNVYLVKGNIWLTFGHLVSMLASFLLAMAFGNLLDPAVYGNYKYLLSLFGILEVTSLIGLNSAVEQAVARDLEGSFTTAFKTKLKWASFGSLAAIGAAVYYWVSGNEAFSVPLLISAVFLPLMNASRIYIYFLNGRKLFDTQTKYGIVTQVVFFAALLATLLLTKNLFWLVAVYLATHTVLNYSFYLITKLRFKPNKEEDPQTTNYGKHVSLMGVISQVATYLDKILLFSFIGPAPLAVYSFATIFPENIEIVLGNINKLALPKLAPKSREEIRQSIMKKTWKLLFLTMAIMVLYIVTAPYFFKILFPQYLASIPYSQAYALSFIAVPASFLATAFSAKMMKKELYLIKIANFINIVLMAVLIPFYGIWGAVIALIGAQIFKFGLVLFLFRKF